MTTVVVKSTYVDEVLDSKDILVYLFIIYMS